MKFSANVRCSRCLVLLLTSLSLCVGLNGCGTDSDIDGDIPGFDVDDVGAGDANNDGDDSTEEDAESDGDNDSSADTDTEPGDVDDNDMTDGAAIDSESDTESDTDDDTSEDIVEDSQEDTVEDTDTIEDTDDSEDGTDDTADGTDNGGGAGTPCASHCQCMDGLFCADAPGTCQPIVINEGYYCCSDGPAGCPDGASCDLDVPEGGEGVCGG